MDDKRFRSRKWILHKQTAERVDLAAAVCLLAAFLGANGAPTASFILQWWATVRGVVLAAYSTANILGRTNDPDPVP